MMEETCPCASSPILDGRASLSRGIWELHNNVRRMQHKPTKPFASVAARYERKPETQSAGCPVPVAEVAETSSQSQGLQWQYIAALLLIVLLAAALHSSLRA